MAHRRQAAPVTPPPAAAGALGRLSLRVNTFHQDLSSLFPAHLFQTWPMAFDDFDVLGFSGDLMEALDQGADPNERLSDGRLWLAQVLVDPQSHLSAEAWAALIARGLDLKACSTAPLKRCAKFEDHAAMSVLLRAGAPLPAGFSCLLAQQATHPEAWTTGQAFRAHPRARAHLQRTRGRDVPLLHLPDAALTGAEQGQHLTVDQWRAWIQALSLDASDLHDTGHFGSGVGVVHKAVSFAPLVFLEAVLREGGPVQARSVTGETPFFLLEQRQFHLPKGIPPEDVLAAMDLLLKYGADAQTCNAHGVRAHEHLMRSCTIYRAHHQAQSFTQLMRTTAAVSDTRARI